MSACLGKRELLFCFIKIGPGEIWEKAMILLKPSAILKLSLKLQRVQGNVNLSFKFQLVKLALKLFYATEN